MKKSKLSLLFVASILSLVACQFGSKVTPSVNSSNVNDSAESLSSVETSVSSVVSSESSKESKESSLSSSSESSSSNKPSSSSSSATSKPSSSSYTSISTTPDSKWNIDLSLRGNAFRDQLERLITSKRTKTASYDDNKSIGPAAAAYGNTGKFVPFYHTTDTLTTYASCNREHTWPNSRGAGKSGPGSDPFIIRPTLTSENSSRGNNFYGVGSGEWDPASCGFQGSRGESARVILYAATAYHTSHKFELSNNPSDPTSANTMGTLKYLIQWNKEYPVTDMEKQINNYLDNHGYGRNPFVDHPEYADFIWNERGIVDISSVGPGGETTDIYENGYDIYSDLASISGKSFAVVSAASADSSYYALDAKITSESTPWYLSGNYVNVKDDFSKMIPVDTTKTLYKWTFNKLEDGKYSIYNSAERKYLTTNVNGTHYNVGLVDSLASDGSTSWTITQNGKGYTFVSGINIYLEYYKSSFCGYNNMPKVPIYLYA